jgi:hypothetical protein
MASGWPAIAEQTRAGIVANITQLLDGLSSSPVLLERFASGRDEGTISVDEALDSRILVSALSTIEDGFPARLCSILIKTMVYRSARVREAAWKAAAEPRNPQEKPCLVLMDEMQEIITADPSSGLSDATFWNVARSSGLAGIFATQTIAALVNAIGESATSNFLQQARSKIFFRAEERETVEYACWCAGAYERNRVVEDEHRESIEHRLLLDGWSPFAPCGDDKDLVFGPRALLKAAAAIMAPDGTGFAVQESAPYAPDSRFRPRGSLLPAFSAEDRSRESSIYLAQMASDQAAAWRAEDHTRNYRMSGNAVQPALTPSDVMQMGRWHAFAQIQRAGVLRQDIIAVDHDFS